MLKMWVTSFMVDPLCNHYKQLSLKLRQTWSSFLEALTSSAAAFSFFQEVSFLLTIFKLHFNPYLFLCKHFSRKCLLFCSKQIKGKVNRLQTSNCKTDLKVKGRVLWSLHISKSFIFLYKRNGWPKQQLIICVVRLF